MAAFGMQQCAQILCQTQAQGDNGERRECPASRGKDRAAGNMQVVDAMHPAVAIDHALLGTVGHSRRAQMMRGAVHLRGCIDITIEPWVELKRSAAGARKLTAEKRRGGSIGMPIEWSKPPVHADLALSEGIDLGTQGDAAVRIGRLFEKTDQIDVAALHGGLVDQAMRECLGNVAHAQAQSQGQCADAGK